MGPRPALLSEVTTYNDYQRQRLLVKPGLTCYWQTRRNRDSVTFDEWVDLDLCTGKRNAVIGEEGKARARKFDFEYPMIFSERIFNPVHEIRSHAFAGFQEYINVPLLIGVSDEGVIGVHGIFLKIGGDSHEV